MQIRVYKSQKGLADVLAIPSRRLRRAPILLQGVTREDLKQRVREVVDELSRPAMEQGVLF